MIIMHIAASIASSIMRLYYMDVLMSYYYIIILLYNVYCKII